MEVLVIQTPQLIVLSGSYMAAGNLIDDKEQDDGDNERPSCTCACRCKLVAHLLPVPIPPAPFIRVVDSVHSWYVVGSEESSQDVTNEAADAVDGEDVKTLIDAQ